MALSTGKTYYQPNGAKVVLDHVHKEEEHEHEANHLIALPVDHLSDKAPVAVLEV